MHPEAYIEMRKLLERAPGDAAHCLDVGSLDVNGNYRKMVLSMGWTCLGLDIREGKNVDVVAPAYEYPFEDGEFDVVISGSTMEHVLKPWLWIRELARVTRRGGLVAILTHHTFPFHEYPVDTFRYFPDGMKSIFDEAGCLSDYHIEMVNDHDIVGSAIKL